MFVHKYVRGTVLLTAIALVLAILALILPWYNVTIVVTDNENYYRDTTMRFSLGFYEIGSSMRSYDYDFKDVGGLMGMVLILTIVWAIAVLLYLATIIPCKANSPMGQKEGFVMGWVLAALALLPSIVFLALMPGSLGDLAIPSFIGSDGPSFWGPVLGWFFALMAGAIQMIAVLTRNVPILMGRFEDSAEQLIEEAAYGDLPLR